jgi:hypothetical protein
MKAPLFVYVSGVNFFIASLLGMGIPFRALPQRKNSNILLIGVKKTGVKLPGACSVTQQPFLFREVDSV